MILTILLIKGCEFHLGLSQRKQLLVTKMIIHQSESRHLLLVQIFSLGKSFQRKKYSFSRRREYDSVTIKRHHKGIYGL
jgi:hypothetical protein